MQYTVVIRYIANFGEESNNSAANVSHVAFWLYKPRRYVWGVQVKLHSFLVLALDGGE